MSFRYWGSPSLSSSQATFFLPDAHPSEQPAHLEALPEVLVVRRGPRRPEALAEGAAQLAADDRRTPMDCALGG